MDEHGAVRLGGQVTNPGGTERLHQYWVHGEGAAKIAWGTPGDFKRCVDHLGKYIRDPQGYCNLAHHAALGFYPATHAKMEHAGRSAMADTKKPYGDVPYADPGYLDADGNQASKSGKPGVERYPLSADKVMAAWSYINQKDNAEQYTPAQLKAIRDRIKAAMGKHGHMISEDSSSRADEPLQFTRSFPLQDVSIAKDGTGRTVEAYAAVFDTPVPIHDGDGDYIEVIDRGAFDRILTKIAPQGQRANWRCGVFYNHGMTIHGSPSDQYSMPIGVPEEIKADARGLFTRTRFHKGELADTILDRIQEGSLPGYSFSGRFHRSQPSRPRSGYGPRPDGTLPVVRRTESTLREYGPTPFPYYPDAVITAVRADLVTAQLDQVAEALRSGTPLDSLHGLSGAPREGDSPAEDSPELRRSGRSVKEEIDAARAAFLLRYRR